MAEPKKIVVDLKGPKQNRAPLSDFSIVCTSLQACLKNVARCIGTKEPKFSISDLKIGSAIMAVEPEVGKNGASDVVRLFSQTIESLEEGQEIDRRLDQVALNCFNGFSGVAKSRDVSLTISRVRLTQHYANNLQALLAPTSESLGSVTGRLEAFNVHNRPTFTLFPPIPGEEIDCNFERSSMHKVLDAVDKQVTVYGTLHYSKSKIFPVRVDVDEFEVRDLDEPLPTLLDAKGILSPLAPDSPLLNPNFADEWY